jgi:hypothetical protein
MNTSTALKQAIDYLDQAHGHGDENVNAVIKQLTKADRLLQAVAKAAPKRRNKWVTEARIPWALVEDIRAALA